MQGSCCRQWCRPRQVRLQTGAGGPYHGALDCTQKTVAREGVRGLYRGMAGMVLLALPRFAFIFHTNALGKKIYNGMESKTSTRVDFGEVLFAGIFSQLFIVPLLVAPVERIKVK